MQATNGEENVGPMIGLDAFHSTSLQNRLCALEFVTSSNAMICYRVFVTVSHKLLRDHANMLCGLEKI